MLLSSRRWTDADGGGGGVSPLFDDDVMHLSSAFSLDDRPRCRASLAVADWPLATPGQQPYRQRSTLYGHRIVATNVEHDLTYSFSSYSSSNLMLRLLALLRSHLQQMSFFFPSCPADELIHGKLRYLLPLLYITKHISIFSHYVYVNSVNSLRLRLRYQSGTEHVLKFSCLTTIEPNKHNRVQQ